MVTITKCLNEWNAIVEALGQGKQTILIRTYGNNKKEFLLYPTSNYAKNEEVLNHFKKTYANFVEENLLPNSKQNKNEVKFFARVEKVLKKNFKNISDLNKFHIWDDDHVKNFVRGKNSYVWILRVYKIEKSAFLDKTRGQRYANVNKGVNITNLTPVLSDKEFEKILKELN